MPSGYLSVLLKRRSKIWLSAFDCCEQGCGMLHFRHVKVTKSFVAPWVAKQRGVETSSIQKLRRGV